MSKRISDAERVVTFFQTADESAATTMVQVIKSILGVRFDKPKVKKRGANKPKLAVAPVPTVEKPTPANSNGNKKLNEEATLQDALRRSMTGGAENAERN